jgi:hypothetical protein
MAQTCETVDLIKAYTLIRAMSCPSNNSDNEMGGQILTAGVYCDTGGPMTLSTDLTLHGSAIDVWFFQANASLVSSMRSKMILTGGALAQNVFWAVAKDAILGQLSTFVGSLLSSGSIFVEKRATINGQLLSRAGVFFNGGNFILNPNAKLLDTDPD